MAVFANALPSLSAELRSPGFIWLAGLLEGEGTFLRPPPSYRGYPIVSCRTTDQDVVERVAKAFGTSVQAHPKGRHKTEFGASIRGFSAVELMRDLQPLMGMRRQAAIDRALAGYRPPLRKLSFSRAEEIRARGLSGETVSSLARAFSVARQTIYAVLDHRIYGSPRHRGWRNRSPELPAASITGTSLSWRELYWLAGWLEGEGSFLRPPPSSPRAPRICGASCDEDVVREVARLLGATARRAPDSRSASRGWSPLWRTMLSGGRAISLMRAVRPVMGQRRQEQIDSAIAAAVAAGAQAPRDASEDEARAAA